MKDKKFVVLCALLAIWLVVFFAMLAGAKVNPRFEVLITVVCACWFAYWTVSIIRNYVTKKETPPVTPTADASPKTETKPTQEVNNNEKAEVPESK